MAVSKHLDAAATKLRAAAKNIEVARMKEFTPATQQEWLIALTDFTQALADLQTYGIESVHEKLHELAARAGIKEFQSGVSSVG